MRIGIIGHYSTANLGDEGSAAAVIGNLALLVPEAELVCFTLDPDAARERYGLEAYPLRARARRRVKGRPVERGAAEARARAPRRADAGPGKAGGIRALLKRFGPVRKPLAALRSMARAAAAGARESVFLGSSFRRLAGVDALVFPGSGLLADAWGGGAWAYPYTIFKWSVMARLRGVRCVFLSSGAEPLHSALSRYFIRKSLRMAAYVSFRDSGSREICRGIGFESPHAVFPDIAHSLPELRDRKMPVRDRESLSIGINPVPIYGDEYDGTAGAAAYDRYIGIMSSLVEHIVRLGHRPRFFCNHPRDEPILADVIRHARERRGLELGGDAAILSSDGVGELLGVIGRFDLVVASRFHALVFPLALCIPCIAVCKDFKQSELMDEYRLGSYAIALDTLAGGELARLLDGLIEHRREVREQLAETKPRFVSRLAGQYREVVDLLR